MIIKRYIVNNMNEAMTRIRYELGKEAVIISQRKIKKPGLAGFFSKKAIEVTAAVENNSNAEKVSESKYKNEDVKDSLEALKKVFAENMTKDENNVESQIIKKNNDFDINKNVENNDFDINKSVQNNIKNRQMVNTGVQYKGISNNKILNNYMNDSVRISAENNNEIIDASNNEILKQMAEMKSMINSMSTVSVLPKKEKTEMEELLTNNDVDNEIIEKIMSKAKEYPESIEEIQKVKLAIEDITPIAKAKLEGPIILVGPTGVGKTTTIAKLAGKLALLQNKKVGLITVDTYRIGAVEQLKTYADIMNIPFKVVFTIKEMEAAVKSMADCDVVLIDTTGRSSKNTMQLSELRAFIEKANTDNIHLVVSSTTKTSDIESIVEGYKVLNYNNIIITKLDETSTYGSILNILEMGEKPLSFVTIGQNVPNDIRELTAENVSKLVLGEDSIC